MALAGCLEGSFLSASTRSTVSRTKRSRPPAPANAWNAARARVFEEASFTTIGTTSAGIAYADGAAPTWKDNPDLLGFLRGL
jgi:2-methylisocitrate lyase-like PEP mutase family enzyme